MNDDDIPIVYESPDGGKTVFGRYSGSSERWLADDHMPFGVPPTDVVGWGRASDAARRIITLKKIVELAETSPTLNDQLKKLEALYILVSDEKH